MLKLLKLGGSVITDKTKPYTPRVRRIKRLARAIADAFFEGNTFVLGHGGGSFPHTSAKRFRTMDGFVREDSALGAGVVHYDAIAINQIVMSALHEEGVPAFSFSPSSLFVARDGEPYLVNVEPIRVALKNSLLPVVFGDVVLDELKGCTIFSTEVVLELIAKTLRANVIGMAEEVGGVYTTDPLKHPDATLIPHISRNNWQEAFKYLGGSHGLDVTGGMRHKVERLLALAREGIRSYIFKGTPKNVYAFLVGEHVPGTIIEW